MNKFEKITISLITLILMLILALGVVVFRQQKAIKAVTLRNGSVAKQAANQNKIPLEGIVKQFSGKIENINGNNFIASVQIPDFSKPKNPEKLNKPDEPVNLTADDFATVEKKINVTTNENTTFEKKSMSDLKLGDVVNVSPDKSLYTADAVIASRVVFIGQPD